PVILSRKTVELEISVAICVTTFENFHARKERMKKISMSTMLIGKAGQFLAPPNRQLSEPAQSYWLGSWLPLLSVKLHLYWQLLEPVVGSVHVQQRSVLRILVSDESSSTI